VLLMAGIRERDKRAVASFGFDGLWQSCTTFVPCSQYVLFELLGAALSPTAVGYFENCSGLICTVNAPRIRRPLFSVEMPVFLLGSRQATCRRFRPTRCFSGRQLRKHTEVTRRRESAYSRHGPTYPFQMPAAGHQCAALASGDPAGRAQFQCLCIRRLSRLHPASFHPQGNRQTPRRGLTSRRGLASR
jgi:hypothetical protein